MPTNSFIFFFFNDTATTEIYTLSLHDALPIYVIRRQTFAGKLREIRFLVIQRFIRRAKHFFRREIKGDRKSTRLNSSHSQISYAVFCLKKKKQKTKETRIGERL